MERFPVIYDVDVLLGFSKNSESRIAICRLQPLSFIPFLAERV
jgi:hypothetical protein